MNLADELLTWVGRPVGVSDWCLLDLERLQQFRLACGQPVSCSGGESDRLPQELLLAMTAPLVQSLLSSQIAARHCINVGVRGVRYGAVVSAPAHIRCSATVLQVHDKRLDRLLLEIGVDIEVQGRSEPAVKGTTEWLLHL